MVSGQVSVWLRALKRHRHRVMAHVVLELCPPLHLDEVLRVESLGSLNRALLSRSACLARDLLD